MGVSLLLPRRPEASAHVCPGCGAGSCRLPPMPHGSHGPAQGPHRTPRAAHTEGPTPAGKVLTCFVNITIPRGRFSCGGSQMPQVRTVWTLGG